MPAKLPLAVDHLRHSGTLRPQVSVAMLALLAGCATVATREGPLPPPSLRDMAGRMVRGLAGAGAVGAAAVVIRDEEVAFDFHGVEDRSSGQKIDRATRFRAGSLTKLLTAMEAARLAEEGQLNLDRPIDHYLPETANLRAEGAGVPTLREILTHRAGLPWNRLGGALGPWEDRRSLRDSLKDLPASLASQPAPYPAGLGYAYSNTGYSLAGLVLEKVTGRRYEALIQDHWLTPLAMHDSGFGTARLSHGYERGQAWPDEALRDIPAGGLVSTPEDLGRFARAILRGGRDHQGRVVLPWETLRSCLLPQGQPGPLDLDFVIGLGWQLRGIEPEGPMWLARHSGVVGRFRAELALAMDRGTGVVLLANTAESESAMLPLAQAALNGLEPVPGRRTLPPQEAKELAVPALPKPKVALPPPSSLAGRYALPGATFTLRPSGEALSFTLAGQSLRLTPDPLQRLRPEALLLGFLPVPPGRLAGTLVIPSVEQDGTWLMLRRPGGFWTFARKVDLKPVPSSWQEAGGPWLPRDAAGFAVERLSLRMEDGHLLGTVHYRTGAQEERHLTPLGDHRALLTGFGRGLGEEWQLDTEEDEAVLRYSGITFTRKGAVATATPAPIATEPPSGSEADAGPFEPGEGLEQGVFGSDQTDAEEAFPARTEP